MRTFRLKNLILGTAVLLLLTAGCGKTSKPSDDSLQKVLDAGQLVIGLDDSFPPMGFTDETGEIIGFDIDMAQEVCDRMGVKLVTQPIEWSEKENELNSGTIDCIWNGMSVSPEREASMCLSKPYVRNELVLVVRSDSDIRNMRDISGKTVGLQSGSTAEDMLYQTGLDTDNEVMFYSNNLELMQSLKQETVDVTLIDSINAYYLISVSDEQFFVLPDHLGDEVMAIGFRKDDQALCDRVQDTLSEMKADGTVKEISTKWFGSDITMIK